MLECSSIGKVRLGLSYVRFIFIVLCLLMTKKTVKIFF